MAAAPLNLDLERLHKAGLSIRHREIKRRGEWRTEWWIFDEVVGDDDGWVEGYATSGECLARARLMAAEMIDDAREYDAA